MARLDVHPMPGKGPGYVIDVQADLLSRLATRAVVPLLPEELAPPAIGDLNPIFEIRGKRHMLVPQSVAAVPVRELKRPVASLVEHRDAITRALDTLFIGF